MDQLASIGIAFQLEAIPAIFQRSVDFYTHPPRPRSNSFSLFQRKTLQWAIPAIYDAYAPVRPFGLGAIIESETGIWNLAGGIIRTPGLYKRADPDTGLPTGVPMTHTNERIHPCVRYRLDMEGLAPDDKGLYKCTALTTSKHGPWKLRLMKLRVRDAIPWDASWAGQGPGERPVDGERRWVWEYDGPDGDEAPRDRVMVEENLGPFQRELLRLTKGENSIIHRHFVHRKATN